MRTKKRKFGNRILVCSFAIALLAGCAAKPNDAQLTTSLKAQMFSDPQIKDANLQVDVKNGVATLSGSVPSDAARLDAYKIAANTPGVSKVTDQMSVQAPEQTAQAAPPQAGAPVEAPPAAVPKHAAKRERPRRGHETRSRKSNPEPEAAPAEAATSAPASASDSQAAATQPANPPASASAQTESSTPAAAPAPPPQPVDAIFPAGTTVEIQTVDPIDAKTSQPGDEFQATLAQPLTWDSRVIVPAGTNVYLRLVAAQESGQYKGRSELQLQLARLELQGQQYQINSSTYTAAGSSRGKDTAKTVGGGAIVGAIIGAIAGGGKGAAIGGAAGAGAGGVYQGVTKAKQVRIPSETRLDFKLEKTLRIPVSSGSGQ